MLNQISIISAQETIFFSQQDGKLRQWITMTVDNKQDQSVYGEVKIVAGDEDILTVLEIQPGCRAYRCYASALWPDRPPVPQAPLHLKFGDETIHTTVSVGSHRPWTIYLLSDVCTDYTWVYADEASMREDDAELMEAELVQIEATRNSPVADRNHYNLVHARQIEFYLERFPERAGRLFEQIRAGNIQYNPFFNMTLTGAQSLEELIRQLYAARLWAQENNLEIRYANHQETPTLTWAMVSVLAGSGVKHLVKSILPHECPWIKRLEEPPVFFWEGPDRNRILVRRRNEDYVEGNFVLKDLQATNLALHEKIAPAYENYGERYPFDAIGLVGCYGDLWHNSRDLPAKKVATITAYNTQGWEFPKLVNASHKQFWDDLEAQIEDRQIRLETVRGDFGTTWETWPTCLAHDQIGWRGAQELAGTADKLAAILSCLDRPWWEARREQLSRGWTNLISLADHAWNGSNDQNRKLNAALRRQWQTNANKAFEAFIHSGLKELCKLVPTGKEASLLVFNGLGWKRSGLVRVEGLPEAIQVVDRTTGVRIPAQVDGQTAICLLADEIPPVGYRIYTLKPQDPLQTQDILEPKGNVPTLDNITFKTGDYRLEGPFYALEASPVTGGITCLYDKLRQQELVDEHSPYHLNQCLYLSEGEEHTPVSAKVESGACGNLFAQLIITADLKNTHLKSTITLYTHLGRVDICNEIEKIPTSEIQELDFAFPFRVPDRHYRYDTPGAIIDPENDYRPGAGQAYTVIRHFVDIFNDHFGVTLSQADAQIVEFGHRTTAEDPLRVDPGNSTVLSVALENCIDKNEAVLDQNGVSQFTFRYSLRGHEGGFDPVSAVQFSGEDNNELLTVILPEDQSGSLPPGFHSFIQAEPENAILATFKPAEEGGLVVRLWECTGQNSVVNLQLSGLGNVNTAHQTDLLERDLQALGVHENQVAIPVQARGITTVRYRISD